MHINLTSIMRTMVIAAIATVGAVSVSYAHERGDDSDSSAGGRRDYTVDCDRGQSLNRVLKRLDRRQSATINVKGTCREYVEIIGLDNLTLQGLPGAALHRPDAQPVPPAFGEVGVVTIIGSSGITLKDLQISAPNTGDGTPQPIGIAIGHGSSDVRLQNLIVQQGSSGVVVFSGSQVYAQALTVRDAGWAALAVYDGSSVHLEANSLLESTTPGFRTGIHMTSSVLNLSAGTVIRNMQYGIWADMDSTVSIHNIRNIPGAEIMIENDPGTNNVRGMWINSGSSATLAARLRIVNPGEGVRIEGNSTLSAGRHLEITGSQGNALYVGNDSYATLLRSWSTGAGLRIADSGRNGIVAVNNSTVELGTPLEFSGNAVTDIFCDSRSLITFGVFVQGAVVQCPNFVIGETEAIP